MWRRKFRKSVCVCVWCDFYVTFFARQPHDTDTLPYVIETPSVRVCVHACFVIHTV